MIEGLVGLDIGTTVAKAVLFDVSGNELCVAEQAYQLQTPRPGWVELEPEEIWQAVLRVLKTVALRSAPMVRIKAIALATQGGTLIPCRARGMPTYRAITWMDRRSGDLAVRWQAEGVGDRVRRVSGWLPEPGLPLLSIGWLREARPDLFQQTEYYLSVNDFVGQRLTGCLGTNPSMAGEMLLTDIASGQWSDELCDLVGIAPGQLSPVLPSEAPLGTLLPEVARATGFAADTAVINGGQDHSCEALALGLDSRGDGMLACGTAWVINAITETSGMDSIPSGMSLNHHVLPNRWVASQFLGGFGACLEWWSQQCRPWQAAETRQERWSALNAALEKSGPGCAGLLYFPQTGLRRGRDAIDHGGFVRLRLDHSQADMGRAIMEAAAFELQWTLEQLVGAGLSLGGIWMVGGATRSPLWPQIVADVTGLPVSLSQYTHGPALGAAILAGLGLGIFGSVGDGLERFRVSAKKVSPNGAGAAAYDRQLASYRQLSRVLVP